MRRTDSECRDHVVMETKIGGCAKLLSWLLGGFSSAAEVVTGLRGSRAGSV